MVTSLQVLLNKNESMVVTKLNPEINKFIQRITEIPLFNTIL